MEVAEENGIDIPGLCHLPGIHDRGACRLCVVKIGGSPRLAAACVTRSARAWRSSPTTTSCEEYRRAATEMIFLERNHVCAVCVANNHCELQDMADDLKVDHFDLPRISPKVDVDAHATGCSRSITTAASCASAASASATRSRARTPGT